MKQVAGELAREFVSQKRGGGGAVMAALDNVALPDQDEMELSLTLKDWLRKLLPLIDFDLIRRNPKTF